MISAHFCAFHKPCRGWRPRQPASCLPVRPCDIRTMFGALFQTLYGTTFSSTARLHKFVKKLKSRRSERANAVRPYIYADSLSCRKIAALFADFVLCRRVVKAVQILCFDIFIVSGLNFALLLFPSAPLSRLAPIEALPQAPQGLCPLPPQAL